MIPVNVLAVRYLAGADPMLAKALGASGGYPSLGMLTTDCDDATYIALDAATKAADVEVCYARSFYAGTSNACSLQTLLPFPWKITMPPWSTACFP